MSTPTNPITVSQPGNVWLSGLTYGTKWETNGGTSPTTIFYAPTAYAGGVLGAGEMAAILQVLADLHKIINVSFVATTESNADIVFASINDADMTALAGSTALGLSDTPGGYVDPATNDYKSYVFADHDQYNGGSAATASLGKGGFDYITWLHEIGHALGLAHPHDNGGSSTIFPGVTAAFGSYGQDELNQGVFTTMSYNDGWKAFEASMPSTYGWQYTMMAFDVAALQNLYGANANTATGNNVYDLSDVVGAGAGYSCIWDAGGSDIISYNGTYSTAIDLRAATLTSGYGAGGYLSYVNVNGLVYGGFTIANGVVIEHAWGGGASDIINGNNSANQLYGNGGEDVVNGWSGDDQLFGGAGNDTMDGGAGDDKLLGGDGNDLIYASLGNDTVYGESGNDFIYGDTGNDVLSGGTGNDDVRGADGIDTLFSGTGLDYMLGGAGIDYFYLNDAGLVTNDQDFMLDFQDAQDGAANNDYIAIKAADYKNSLIFDQWGYTWIATYASAGYAYTAITGTSAAHVIDNLIFI